MRLPIAMSSAIAAAAMTLGCGFKSDLYLPENRPSEDIDRIEVMQVRQLKTTVTPSKEPAGTVVEIPRLDDDDLKKNKNAK